MQRVYKVRAEMGKRGRFFLVCVMYRDNDWIPRNDMSGADKQSGNERVASITNRDIFLENVFFLNENGKHWQSPPDYLSYYAPNLHD